MHTIMLSVLAAVKHIIPHSVTHMWSVLLLLNPGWVRQLMIRTFEVYIPFVRYWMLNLLVLHMASCISHTKLS